MPDRIAFVDYLALEPEAHLVAHECDGCSARYFDHRFACAACSATTFHDVDISTTGEVRAFTIVSLAAPGIPTPFVAAVLDCDGTSVRANLINVPPDPEHVSTGMKVRLATYVVGVDEAGTEAIGFGFEPLEGAGNGQ
ncbi:MAG TPA: OB-fold domain-containing protein [Acidimicrobiales bacterium]|nr:OB-fold domain-containing protein [Acidimicrobiales bacterium]